MAEQLVLPGFKAHAEQEDRYVCSCGNSLWIIRDDYIECPCGLKYVDDALPVTEFNATRDPLKEKSR